MSNHQTPSVYTFLDFQLFPHQRLLLKNQQAVKLSKKNYEILLVLIEADGHVVEKDSLIHAVWPNQIVTDAALNKQITRLREVLNSDQTQDLIQTVRGVGVRFIPAVKKLDSNTTSKKRFIKPALALLFFVAIGLFWWHNKAEFKPTDHDYFAGLDSINIALMPGVQTGDWLNVGGINHLAQKLIEYPGIQTIEPEFNWFDRADTDQLAIEINQNEDIQYVLLVNSRTDNDIYLSDLQLRNQTGVVAKDSLQAANVNMLLNKVEIWTIEQLRLSAQLAHNKSTKTKQTTDFAMENYIRGLAAAENKRYQQAKQLFQTAVDEDAKFYLAWLGLIEATAELGQFDHALNLLESLYQSDQLDEVTSHQFKPVQAKILVYLNRLPEAQKLLDESIAWAKAQQAVEVMIKSLHTQVLLYDYRGELDESGIGVFKELLRLTKQFKPSPNRIASLLHNLAVNYLLVGDINNATNTIHSAISQFNSTDNAEGLLSSYRVLAEILYTQAKNGEALLVLEKASPHLPAVDSARPVAHYLMILARNQYEQGLRSAALETIDKLHQMSVTYATLQPKVKGLIIEAELGIVYEDYEFARTAIDNLLKIIITQPEAYPADAPYAAALDMYLSARIDAPDIARAKKQEYLSAYPELKSVIENELERIEAWILARTGFEQQAIEMLLQLEETYLNEQHDTLTANYIAYELLELQWGLNKQAYMVTLNRLEQRAHFAYPMLLFKAQSQAFNGDLIQAIASLNTMKSQAKQLWQAKHQILLDSYLQQIKADR